MSSFSGRGRGGEKVPNDLHGFWTLDVKGFFLFPVTGARFMVGAVGNAVFEPGLGGTDCWGGIVFAFHD